MAKETKQLKLYQVTCPEDEQKAFNIQTMLNDNWDKIDKAFEKASTTDAEEGIDAEKIMTPKTTKDAILKLAPQLQYKDVTNLSATTAGAINWTNYITNDVTRVSIMVCLAAKDISNYDYAKCAADSTVVKKGLVPTVTTYSFTELANNTQYWVKVFNNYRIVGNEIFSKGATVTFTTLDVMTKPEVANLTSKQSGMVSWTLPTENAPYRIGIEVFKATKDISNFDHATCVADGTVTKTTLGKDVTNTTLSGLATSTQYWVKVFVKYTVDGVNSYSSGVSTSFTTTAFADSSIFGVAIDTANSNPSTAVTYTDNAVGLIPMSGNNGNFQWGSWQAVFDMLQIKPCVLKNGVVQYYLNPNDFSKKADGTSADITSGTAGDVMIEFGKPIYWKFSQTGSTRNIRFSLTKQDSGYKALAHTVGTTLKNKIYLPAYLGYYDGTKLRSLSSKAPTVNQTIGAFRTYAQANGTGYQQMGYYPLLMLQVLYAVFFKSLDSQTALGRGYVDGNASATNTGGTNAKGMFYGENTGKQQIKFCGVEDFYGNYSYWLDGFFIDASRNILISNQSTFNDTATLYANLGKGATGDMSGYFSEIQGGTENGFVMKSTNGSASTYYCDYGVMAPSCFPCFGGSWCSASLAGSFQLEINNPSSHSLLSIASRLLYIG